MSKDEKKPGSLDVLGLKPLAGAIEHASNKTIDGIGAVLARICLPAAEEIGLALRDRVSMWRAINIAKTIEAAKPLIDKLPNSDKTHAHPRLVHEIVDQASWTDDHGLQSMWGGLLASSCSTEGGSQENLLFINILRQLSPIEAMLVRHSVQTTKKTRTRLGWIVAASHVEASLADLQTLTSLSDVHQIDLALDHLRSLSLIDPETGGFWNDSDRANLTATSMAMQLYARCEGWKGTLVSFYNLDAPPEPL